MSPVHAACNCGNVQWIKPSTTTDSTFRFVRDTAPITATLALAVPEDYSGWPGCNANSCGTALSTVVFTEKPSWVTYDAGTNLLTITPTSDALVASSPYLIKVVQTLPYGKDATLSFDANKVILEYCTVTSFTAPANPAAVAYNVGASAITMNLASSTWVQSPACGHPIKTQTYSLTQTDSNFVLSNNAIPSVTFSTSNVATTSPQTA